MKIDSSLKGSTYFFLARAQPAEDMFMKAEKISILGERLNLPFIFLGGGGEERLNLPFISFGRKVEPTLHNLEQGRKSMFIVSLRNIKTILRTSLS